LVVVVVLQTYYGLMSFLVMFREDDVYKFSDWAEAASKKKEFMDKLVDVICTTIASGLKLE